MKLELNFTEFLKNRFPIKIKKLMRNTVLIKVYSSYMKLFYVGEGTAIL
jgi:hypothetical protein